MELLERGVFLLDYGAGNVRSLVNAVNSLGYAITPIEFASDFERAERVIFPGVGAFGAAMQSLEKKGFLEPLSRYLASGRPFFGICVGMQVLFQSSAEFAVDIESTENNGDPDKCNVDFVKNNGNLSKVSFGLGLIPAKVCRLSQKNKAVPHIGWNNVRLDPNLAFESNLLCETDSYYFVHSFAVLADSAVDSSVDISGSVTASALAAPVSNIESGTVPNLKSTVLNSASTTVSTSFANSTPPTTTSNPKTAHGLNGWIHSTTTYGDETFVSSVRKGCVFATQFHPEKSGNAGLALLKRFLTCTPTQMAATCKLKKATLGPAQVGLTRRIIACLDVRSDDNGELVVTKGHGYSVRDPVTGLVRNLGDPVALAKLHYDNGCDELVFLNITSFRNVPLNDQPMLSLLSNTSREVFVPLTIGGGIRDIKLTIDGKDTTYTALQVASTYFRCGADKVSIGSDAVFTTEALLATFPIVHNGMSSIEQISRAYGAQAVVVSVDPKRMYVADPRHCPEAHRPCLVKLNLDRGPEMEEYCYWLCTVKGGREVRDLDVVQLLKMVESLGAGEVMVNCIDKDGKEQGFDVDLMKLCKQTVRIPVIASSGAGTAQHFVDVFKEAGVDAALAAGIFHKGQVAIMDVKRHCTSQGLPARQ